MEALGLALGVGVVLIVAYFTYGRWVARRVFALREDAVTPAVELNDNCDYCPTKKSIVFGHHFTSIAGTGPIVGPAIAVMWGWLPAVLWVVVGSIFIGAVHDLGSLVVSLRNKGRSIGDIAGDLLGPRVRLIFLVVLVMALWIVLAIFGLVVAGVLRQYPQAITPVVVQIPLALLIGGFIHRRGKSLVVPSVLALGLMYASVIWGDVGVLGAFNALLAAQPTWLWVVALLAYSYAASVLPVWVLLQPRDYINALQLITAMGLLVVGLVVAGLIGGIVESPDVAAGLVEASGAVERVPLEIVAPMVNWNPEGAPPMIPLLFITIACGAISGFHCLVSSGTTSKQLEKETDAQFIGYGSMLTEGFLATLVILSCAAGIGLGISKLDAGSLVGAGRGADGWSMREFFLESRDGAVYHTLLARQPGEPMGTINVGQEEVQEWRIAVFLVDGLPPKAERNVPMNSLVGAGLGFDGSIMSYKRSPDELTGPRNGEPIASQRGDVIEWMPIPGGVLRPESGQAVRVRGELAFDTKYSSWSSAGALSAKVGAFVDGSANLIKSMGIPGSVAVALMGVLVASFAGTTMDSACRLQRYVIQELSRTFLPRPPTMVCRGCGYSLRGLAADAVCPECAHENVWRMDGGDAQRLASGQDDVEREASAWNPFRWLATRHGATMFAVVTAAVLAFIPAPGQGWSLANAGAGGLILWPLFGATNQLLGGMSFLVIAAWLIATKKPVWFVVVPTALMLVLPAWALVLQAFVGAENTASWWSQGDWILVSVAGISLVLEAWLVTEVVVRMFARKSGRSVGG